EDYAWLEAVFTRQIPGNLYLINPLKKNLLSREASSARPSGTNTAGVYTVTGTGGVSTWVRVTDCRSPWQPEEDVAEAEADERHDGDDLDHGEPVLELAEVAHRGEVHAEHDHRERHDRHP